MANVKVVEPPYVRLDQAEELLLEAAVLLMSLEECNGLAEDWLRKARYWLNG